MNRNRKLFIAIAVILVLIVLSTVLLVPLFIPDDITEDVETMPETTDLPEPVENSKPDNINSYDLAVETILENTDRINTSFGTNIDSNYIEKIKNAFGSEMVEKLANALDDGNITSENMHSLLGISEKAFTSIIENSLNRTTVIDGGDGTTELVFVGDTSFADGYSVLNHYISREKGIEGIVSPEVLEIMRSADITMANNEFTFTERGYPIPDKKFTFRSKPENVKIYYEMGVDIVGMANNHAFDYGPDSLTDTLKTLDDANIHHVGAGENLADARAPYYYIVNGYKIAYVAGSAIDPWSTRGAKENQSGVFQIFDTVSMCETIKEAKANADYVIAYVHWGRESTTVLTDGQKSMGKAFVDAGADVVVGMHSHCMQGLEYYKDKLIVYSLGNFTFSRYNLTCGMLKVNIDENGDITNTFYPMMQEDNFTYINSGEKGTSQLELLESLLINTSIDDNYVVSPKEKE